MPAVLSLVWWMALGRGGGGLLNGIISKGCLAFALEWNIIYTVPGVYAICGVLPIVLLCNFLL